MNTRVADFLKTRKRQGTAKRKPKTAKEKKLIESAVREKTENPSTEEDLFDPNYEEALYKEYIEELNQSIVVSSANNQKDDKSRVVEFDYVDQLFWRFLKDLGETSIIPDQEIRRISKELQKRKEKVFRICPLFRSFPEEDLIRICCTTAVEKFRQVALNGIQEKAKRGKSSLFKKIRETAAMCYSEGILLRRSLAQPNLRLVLMVARRHIGHGLSLLDLIQEGSIGLIKAADKYNWKEFKFSTYAFHWIRQMMTRAINDQAKTIRVPVHALDYMADLKKKEDQFVRKHHRKPNLDEILKMGKKNPKLVEHIMQMVKSPLSLDMPIPNDTDDDDLFLGDFIRSPCLSPEEMSIRREMKGKIDDVLATLEPREEKVIRMRMGIDHDTDYTLEEIGGYFGLTRERIRQIETKAIRKLKHPERRKKLEDFRDV